MGRNRTVCYNKTSKETTNSEQKEIIDKAWDLLAINKQTLIDITNMYQQGDQEIASENYAVAKFNYIFNDRDSKQVGDNLNEIPKLLEKVEKMQTQTCFLWWCW